MDFQTLRFIIVAAILYGLFHFGYHKVPDSYLKTQVYPNVIGHPAAKVITVLTPSRYVNVRDNAIASKSVVLNIVRGCDGSGVWFMLMAAILAFGANLKHTLSGLIIGTLTVYIVNQIRIVGLFYLVGYDRMLFPAVHTYFAPTLIIFIIAGFFLWWTRWSIASPQNAQRDINTGNHKER